VGHINPVNSSSPGLLDVTTGCSGGDILAGTWAEFVKQQSVKIILPTDVFEVSIPGLPEGARPLRMVRIPSGRFQMGSPDTERGRKPDEGPVHSVTIAYDFYMGETEITQAQWQAVMGSKRATRWVYEYARLDRQDCDASYGVGPDFPVNDVSWNEIKKANGFLAKLNALGQGTFRLPSEAEWEYACRAGTTTRFYFGDSLSCGDNNEDCAADALPGNRSDYMWYFYNDCKPNYGPKPVGTKLPNAFGLYDMHGNVWEWCQDFWHANYVGAPSDGSPWYDSVGSNGCSVVRGGDWGSDWDFGAWACRSAVRNWDYPGCGGYSVGLRVVLPVSP